MVENQNMMVRRLFVCVVPPKPVLDAAMLVRAPLADARGFRPVPRENMHITLHFLGDVAVQSIGSVAAELGNISREIDFERAGGPGLSLAPVGCFPDCRRPKAVWIGITDDTGSLTRLAQSVAAAVRATGQRSNGPRFRPHLTLARVRRSATQHEVSEAILSCRDADLFRRRAFQRDSPDTPFTITEMILMESRLGPNGPTYIPLQRFPLGAD